MMMIIVIKLLLLFVFEEFINPALRYAAMGCATDDATFFQINRKIKIEYIYFMINFFSSSFLSANTKEKVFI